MLRAHHQDQKQVRRQEILQAARRLFRSMAFAEITMAQVAEEAGLAKGTTYLYFPTKEALFLELMREEFNAWFTALERGLEALSRPVSGHSIATLLADATAERPTFRALVVLAHGILEHNIPVELALHFKHELLARGSRVAELLESRMPILPPGEGWPLLLRAYALLLGFQQLSEPSPVVRSLLGRPEMAPFNIDFREGFHGALEALFQNSEER